MAALPNGFVASSTTSIDEDISEALRHAPPAVDDALRVLLGRGLDRLPLPGGGATLQRWQVLERVARHDLSLAKLYESHVDALAILCEIDGRPRPDPGLIHAVWASEARVDPIAVRRTGIVADRDEQRSTRVVVDGRKSWCSGADLVDIALMTAVDADGARVLVELRLDADGLSIDRSRWHAVGMNRSGSFDVLCNGVHARLVGPNGGYLDRPGFWHGGAGVAACWYGAAAAIGTRVRDLQRQRDDLHALAHLGAIDAALACGAALLRETAAAIDTAPARDAMRIVLRARGAIADLCEEVIHHAVRAVGPGPLCNEADLAQRIADLPIFIRQSRAEHDRVAQSRALLADADERDIGWTL